MDLQLNLTFTGKSHKNDLDFRSHSLVTLITRRIRTLTTITIIRVQTAIMQLKMEENSVKTLLKFAVFKNGGKLEKTGYTGSIRSPKTERAPSQPENHSTCPKAHSAGVCSPKTERIPPQENYCTCLWAQSAQLSQLISHPQKSLQENYRTCPVPSQPENYCTYAQLSQLISQNPQLRKPALPSGAKLSVFQLLFLSKRQLFLLLSQQKHKRLLRVFQPKLRKLDKIVLSIRLKLFVHARPRQNPKTCLPVRHVKTLCTLTCQNGNKIRRIYNQFI